MVKFLNPGKVVIILQGRFAGKKAVIMENYNLDKKNGDKSRNFGYAVVVGIERTPLKVTKSMNAKKVSKRSTLKPFIKAVNYNHLMPTRYALDIEALKDKVTLDTLKGDQTKRRGAKKVVKNILQDQYRAGKNKYFYAKLRF